MRIHRVKYFVLVDKENKSMSEHLMKPIWYFVGLILLVIGGLIFLSGLYQLIVPPATTTVLANTHPNIWWGAVMVVFGGGMFIKTRKQTS
jgi:FtsH-binding integral membrane protein